MANVKKIVKTTSKITLFLLLLGISGIIALYFLLKTPKFQTFIAQKITENLSEKLGVDVSVESVDIEFFNKIEIQKLYLSDQNNDTLAYVPTCKAEFSYFSLLRKKINLSNLSIQGAKVRISRAYDSEIFNFNFLNQQSNTLNAKSSQKPWDLQLNDIILTDLDVMYHDYYSGTILDGQLDQALLDLDFVKLGEKKYEISLIELTKPDVSLKKIVSNPNFHSNNIDSLSLNLPFSITCNNFNLREGNLDLYLHPDSTKTPNQFAFSNIIFKASSSNFIYDRLYTSVDSFAFDEKGGLNLKQFESAILLNNEKLAFKNLSVITAKSSLHANADFNYNSLNDFKHFVDDVRWDLQVSPSVFNPSDIEKFVNFKGVNLNNPIDLEGHIYGTVSNFKSKNLKLTTLGNVVFEGEFAMNGLPKANEAFISGRVNKFTISYTKLKQIYPSLPLPDNIARLGTMSFNGKFDGFIKDFVAQGNLVTEIGSAQTDLNFKIDPSNNANYSGSFSLRSFDIGKFFELENKFGKVTLKGRAIGKGIQLNTLNLDIEGMIESVDILDYTYHDIAIKGQVKDKFFNGKLNVSDDNIDLDFDGFVDATDKVPHFNFTADVKKLYPKGLKLMEKDYSFSGIVKADVSATKLEDVLGKINVQNFSLNTNDKTYNFGDAEITSKLLVNDQKRFTVNSKDIKGTVEGDFSFNYLPLAFKKVLIPNVRDSVPDQLFKFDFFINNNPDIVDFVLPNLKLNEPSNFSGNLDSKTNSMLAVFNVPIVQYDKFTAFDLHTNMRAVNGDFDFIFSMPEVYHNDSIVADNITLLASGPRNELNMKLFAQGLAETTLNIEATLENNNRRSRLVFLPSNIFINQQYWLIDKDNYLILGDKIVSKNLKLYNGTSELALDFEIDNHKQQADVALNNIFLEDFTQFLKSKDIDLKGVVNGQLKLNVQNKKPLIEGDIIVENIKINNYEIGNLNTSANLDLPNSKVYINGNLYGNDNQVDINGSYSFSPKSTIKDLDFQIDVKNFAIYTVEDFIKDYIDNAKGTVTGKLSLTGFKNKPDLLGYLDINDVTTTVSYLQTTYNLNNHRVLFEKNAINIGNQVKVTDIEGNVAYGSGKILHQNLKNFALDIDVTSQKIMGINTTYDDNQDFYGKAYLNGSASFKGPVNDVVISIKGLTEAKSELSIPLIDNGISSQYSFYSFAKPPKTEKEKLLSEKIEKFKVNNLTVNLDLDVNTNGKINIILDQSSGDVLEVVGEGNIKIAVPKDGDIQLYGHYVISSGDYLFTLQNVINKKFKIDPGSYIDFEGNIEESQVHVDAVYNVRAAPKSLIEDYIQQNDLLESAATTRIPVKLLLTLRNNLYSPDIDFDIEFAQLNPNLKSYVERKVVMLKQYQNEMNRQVFGLLMLNQFLPPLSSLDQLNTGFGVNANSAANTVSEFLSNQMTRYFNDWISFFSDDVSFNFNYRNYQQDVTSPTGGLENLNQRREFQLALTTKFFNDRIIVNVGGNVDFGENSNGTQNNNNATYFGGNASIEYALTENRRFRIKAFTTTDYDYYYQTNNTRAGVGLSFKKEFDKSKDIKIDKEEFKFNTN